GEAEAVVYGYFAGEAVWFGLAYGVLQDGIALVVVGVLGALVALAGGDGVGRKWGWLGEHGHAAEGVVGYCCSGGVVVCSLAGGDGVVGQGVSGGDDAA